MVWLPGLLGAGGQLILFEALREGPAYIVFPLISLFPVLTIFLSVAFLKEQTNKKHWIGIILALVAAVFLANPKLTGNETTGNSWLMAFCNCFYYVGCTGLCNEV